MTMRSRLLLLLAVAAIVGGAFYFVRSPAAPVDGGTAVAAGGGAQTSRQATRSEMCGSSHSTGRMTQKTGRMTPSRRPAAMYSDSERSVRLLLYHRNQRLECRS